MKNPRKNKPVQQHYVTSGYLKGFTVNEKCVVKDLKKNQIRENQNPEQICRIKNYNTLDIPEDPMALKKRSALSLKARQYLSYEK